MTRGAMTEPPQPWYMVSSRSDTMNGNSVVDDGVPPTIRSGASTPPWFAQQINFERLHHHGGAAAHAQRRVSPPLSIPPLSPSRPAAVVCSLVATAGGATTVRAHRAIAAVSISASQNSCVRILDPKPGSQLHLQKFLSHRSRRTTRSESRSFSVFFPHPSNNIERRRRRARTHQQRQQRVGPRRTAAGPPR